MFATEDRIAWVCAVVFVFVFLYSKIGTMGLLYAALICLIARAVFFAVEVLLDLIEIYNEDKE